MPCKTDNENQMYMFIYLEYPLAAQQCQCQSSWGLNKWLLIKQDIKTQVLGHKKQSACLQTSFISNDISGPVIPHPSTRCPQASLPVPVTLSSH